MLGCFKGQLQAPDPRRRGSWRGPDRSYARARAGETVAMEEGPNEPLIQIPALLLTAPLPGERLLRSTLVTRLQIERVLLDILDDIFLLNLTLETAEGALDRLAVLYFHFSH